MSLAARDALEYATRDEYLKLYAVLAGGWVVTVVGQSIAGTAMNAFVLVVGALLEFAGLLATLAAAVAVLHKIIAES